jgi:hypothetical protein
VCGRLPSGAEAIARAVRPGATGVRLVLREGGGVRGDLVGFDHTPEIAASRGDRSFDATVTGDAFEIASLPAGRYEISATQGKEEPVLATVRVRPGEVTRVTLTRHPRTATVSIRLLDEKGADTDGTCMVVPADQAPPDDLPLAWARVDFWRYPSSGTLLEGVPPVPSKVYCHWAGQMALADADPPPGVVTELTMTLHDLPPSPSPGFLGIQGRSDDDGVAVLSVVAGGPAERAGVVAGDEIQAIDDLPLADGGWGRFTAIVESRGAGARVTLQLARGPVAVILGERP